MILSNTCKYGIRAVIYLALNNGENKKIGIKEISGNLNIPSPFLGKIMQLLAKHKILTSTKGPHGGFGLGLKTEQISLYDIVKVIDGDDVFTTCLIGMNSCDVAENEHQHCPVHKDFGPIRDQIISFFKEKNIMGLADEIRKDKDIVL